MPLPARGIEAHQAPMSFLIGRIGPEQTMQQINGAFVVGSFVVRCQRLQHPLADEPQPLPSNRGPIFVQVLFEQVALVQCQRCLQLVRIACPQSLGGLALKLVNVDSPARHAQDDLCFHGLNEPRLRTLRQLRFQRPPGRMDHLVQVVQSQVSVSVGPQDVDQLLAMYLAAGRQRQHLHQDARFLARPTLVVDGNAVYRGPEASE